MTKSTAARWTLAVLFIIVILGVASSLCSLHPCERHHARLMCQKIESEPNTDFVVLDWTKVAGSGADYSKGYELLRLAGGRVRLPKSGDDTGDKGVGISRARFYAPFIVRIESGWMEKFNGGADFFYFALFGKVFLLRTQDLWSYGL